jgi:hypothetical protein
MLGRQGGFFFHATAFSPAAKPPIDVDDAVLPLGTRFVNIAANATLFRVSAASAMLQIYNSLTRRKAPFTAA